MKKFHSQEDTSTYILNYNLNNYIEQVDKSYILHKLKAIPQITKQIKFWLEWGILNNLLVTREISDQIVPTLMNRKLQNIGPFLINVAFHGFESDFKN